MKIDRFQRNAIIICVLPIIAIAIASYIKRPYLTRELFLIRDGLIFSLWGLSFLWGSVNAVLILTDQKLQFTKRIFWAIVSLLSIIFVAIMLCTSFIIDEVNDDDMILESGERIDGYYRNS